METCVSVFATIALLAAYAIFFVATSNDQRRKNRGEETKTKQPMVTYVIGTVGCIVALAMLWWNTWGYPASILSLILIAGTLAFLRRKGVIGES